MAARHFLTLSDLSVVEIQRLLKRATEMKKLQQDGVSHRSLEGKVLAMIFEQSSTRTRVGFEAGMAQLGGHAIFLSPQDTHLSRGEPITHTAKTLAQMVDGVMMRTASHEHLEVLAKHSSVPVINAMTSFNHPCQLLADLQTWQEQRGDIEGATVAFLGDGYNMCRSYMHAALHLSFQLQIGCPAAYQPDLSEQADRIMVTADPVVAVTGADLVVTDVWNSLSHDKNEHDARRQAFAPYQVNLELMAKANKDALFMHCLPAHVGEEVSADMLDHPASLVWEEAGNRLHTQKALLELLLA